MAMHKLLIFLAALAVAAARAETLDLRDGDRVALIGDTLIEREQESGWLETVMGASFADRRRAKAAFLSISARRARVWHC
jgi:urease gamma subunit